MSRLFLAAIVFAAICFTATGQNPLPDNKLPENKLPESKLLAERKPNAPETAPPRWVRVRMDDEERVRVREFVVSNPEPRYVTEERTQRVVDPDGNERDQKVPVQVPKVGKPIVWEQVDFVPLKHFTAVTAGGKSVSQNELLARFEKDTFVLLTHGQVDSYYLPLFKEDTLIITLPAKDAASLSPLPNAASAYVPGGYAPGAIAPRWLSAALRTSAVDSR